MTKSKRATSKDQAGNENRVIERLDLDAGVTEQNIPANEETEGATHALEAPEPPPEMTKDKKSDKM